MTNVRQITDVDYLSLKELAARLSLSERTLRNYIRDCVNPLPCYRIGGKLIFSWKEAEAWVQSHRIEPKNLDRILDGLI